MNHRESEAEFSSEQLEEYRQLDSRIVALLTSGGKYLTGYFVGFFAFLAWLAASNSELDPGPLSLMMAFGLLFGVVLLDSVAIKLERVRAYKIVFFERKSCDLFYESARLCPEYTSLDRRNFIGLLGVALHALSVLLIFFDPLDKFIEVSLSYLAACLGTFSLGGLYSIRLLVGSRYIRKHVALWQMLSRRQAEASVLPNAGPDTGTADNDSGESE